MNLNTIINHIRQHCPSFGGRVAGAARFQRLDEDANMAVPAAYVIPLDDEPGEAMSLNGDYQMLIDGFAVVVALSNVPDERGQTAVTSAYDAIRAELWAGLVGFRPSDNYNAIYYRGGNLLEMDRSRLWYEYDFAAEMNIGPADGWQEQELSTLPHFDSMNIKVDAIDPMADPNLSYPGPDTRIEHEINIPKTGTLP